MFYLLLMIRKDFLLIVLYVILKKQIDKIIRRTSDQSAIKLVDAYDTNCFNPKLLIRKFRLLLKC